MKIHILLASCALIAAAPAAFAKPHGEKGDKGHKSYERHESYKRHDGNHDDSVFIRIDDQRAINAYYGRQPGFCPPGLAKKNPRCMPPGQYKKFGRGDILPDYVHYDPLPHELLQHLYPVVGGAQYVRVDQNVYLIAEGTKKVLDAMVLFSGVNQ